MRFGWLDDRRKHLQADLLREIVMAAPAPPVRKVEKVSFVCQRCKQPLKIDPSFGTIDQQNELVKELTGINLGAGVHDSLS